MTEEIERHVVRKFEICQRLGKGVSQGLRQSPSLPHPLTHTLIHSHLLAFNSLLIDWTEISTVHNHFFTRSLTHTLVCPYLCAINFAYLFFTHPLTHSLTHVRRMV